MNKKLPSSKNVNKQVMIADQQISAFDLDHTLFRDNSSYRFGLYLYRKGLIRLNSLIFILKSHLMYRLGLLSIPNLHQQAFQHLFQGRPSLIVNQWVHDFLDTHFERLRYPPAIEKLRQAQDAGHTTAILSSSPAFLVQPIAKRLGVTFCQSTEYGVDRDQQFSHISKLMLGEDKALFIENLLIEQKISRQHITAYSDSYHDLPFLLAAGTAVGVNPDKKLRSFCEKNHWLII